MNLTLKCYYSANFGLLKWFLPFLTLQQIIGTISLYYCNHTLEQMCQYLFKNVCHIKISHFNWSIRMFSSDPKFPYTQTCAIYNDMGDPCTYRVRLCGDCGVSSASKSISCKHTDTHTLSVMFVFVLRSRRPITRTYIHPTT